MSSSIASCRGVVERSRPSPARPTQPRRQRRATSAGRRPRTNQTARAGTSPALNRRCGVAESKLIASPGWRRNSSKPIRTVERAAQDVAPLLARVALERVGRARLAADLVGHVEEVDVADRLGRQPLPDDAGTEPDARPRGRSLHGIVRQRRSRAARPALVVRPSAAGGGCGVHEQQHVERDAELVGQRVQRVDRRLGAAGLDLGDQARRHAEDLGQADAGSGPRAGRAWRRRSPIVAYSGSVDPFRRSRPTPPSSSVICGHRYPSSVPTGCAGRAGCVALVNGRALPPTRPSRTTPDAWNAIPHRRDRPFASPGAMTVDWEERVNPDRLRTYRLGRAEAALAASDLGAMLLFDFNNIRYVTSTHIGEWARDKMTRYALLTRGGEPHIWDFGSAAKHHRLNCPWLPPENIHAGMVGLRGAVAPDAGLFRGAAREIARHPPGRGRRRHAARRRHRRAADARRARGRGDQRPRRPAGDARRPRGQVDRRDHAAQHGLRDGRRRLPADRRAAQAGHPRERARRRTSRSSCSTWAPSTSTTSTPSRASAAARIRTSSATGSSGPATRPSSTSSTRSSATRPATTGRSSSARPPTPSATPTSRRASGSTPRSS